MCDVPLWPYDVLYEWNKLQLPLAKSEIMMCDVPLWPYEVLYEGNKLQLPLAKKINKWS